MMQLTAQKRNFSGGYKMTNGSRVRKLVFNNRRIHQRKRSNFVTQRNSVDERVDDGKSMVMPNKFYKKQCHV